MKPANLKSAREESGVKLPATEAVWVCIFLVILVVAVFGQTVRFGFVNYDDNFNVYQNPVVEHGLNLKGAGWAFTHAQVANWIPLTTLSHMLDCQFFGINAGGHHLINVLFHAATVVLLFLMLRQMTGALWRSAFVAAVFAVHPLHVESVAWVSERKDVLSGVFFMLTILAYLHYVCHLSWRRYLIVLLAFVLGLMSKPMLVTLPLLLLLLDYWPLRRFESPRFLIPWRLVREKIPLMALSAVFCVIALSTQEGARNSTQPLSQHLANSLASYVIYLKQMFWPAKLAVHYPYPEHGFPLGELIMAFLVLASISAAAWIARGKYPCLLVGWLWYLGMLVPVIGLVQVGEQAHADRYTYLPQIGLYLVMTWLIADLSPHLRHRFLALASLSMIILVILIFCARIQTSYWKDNETLWTHTLACTGNNDVAHNQLGTALLQKGRVDEAIIEFQKALAISPDYDLANLNLGDALLQKGQLDESIIQFQKALTINPDNAGARNNLGNALVQKGRLDDAIVQFQKALAGSPDFADAHNDLGNALVQKGRLDDAIVQFQKALAGSPDFVDAHNDLGAALLQKGKVDEAMAHFQKVLILQPNYVAARINLDASLMQTGRMAEAVDDYWKVLETQPENVDALNNLAWALATCPQASLRDGASAVALAQKAVRLSGGENPLMLRTLAAAYAETGRYSDAVETARHALRLAAVGVALAGSLQKEIELYDASTPVRDVKP